MQIRDKLARNKAAVALFSAMALAGVGIAVGIATQTTTINGNIFVAPSVTQDPAGLGSDTDTVNCKRFATKRTNAPGGGRRGCATLNKAYSLAQPGDTVCIRPTSTTWATQDIGWHSSLVGTTPNVHFIRCGAGVARFPVINKSGTTNVDFATNMVVTEACARTDCFTRANASSLGGNWVTDAYANGFAGDSISSNQAKCLTSDPYCSSYFNTGYGQDVSMYAQKTSGSGNFFDIFLATSGVGTSSIQGYDAFYDGVNTLQLNKNASATSSTQLGSNVTLTLNSGDYLGLSIVGSTVNVYSSTDGVTWTNRISVTDTTYRSTSTKPALVLGQNVQADNMVAVNGNFFGGAITPPSGPTTPVLDTFTGSNGTTLVDPPWAQPIQSTLNGALTIQSNHLKNTDSSIDHGSAWRRDIIGVDEEAYASLFTLGSGEFEIGRPYVRYNGNPSSPTGYYVIWFPGSGDLSLRKVISGAVTVIGSGNSAFTSGDKLWLKAIGNALSVSTFHSGAWTTQITATDSSITAAGQIGVDVTKGSDIDDFGGGTFDTSPPPPPPVNWSTPVNLTDVGGSPNYIGILTSNGSTLFMFYQEGSSIFERRSTDEGASWTTAQTVATADELPLTDPAVAVGTTVHLLYARGGDMYYRRSTDSGVTFGAETKINSVTNTSGQFYRLSMDATSTKVRIAWVRESSPNSATGIYYRASDDNGVTWGSVVTGLVAGSNRPSRPSLKFFANGTRLGLTWGDRRDDTSGLNNCYSEACVDVYYKTSTDSGTTWGSDQQITSDAASPTFAQVERPDLVTNADGSAVLSWQDDLGIRGYEEIFSKYSATGATFGGTTTRQTNADYESEHPSSASVSNKPVLTWFDRRNGPGEPNPSTNLGEIMAKVSTDSGQTFGGEEVISSLEDIGAPAAAATTNYYHVVWPVNNDVIKYSRRPVSGTPPPPPTCNASASPGAGTAQSLLASLSSGQVGCLHTGIYTATGSYVLDFSNPNVTIRSYPGERATLNGLVIARATADGSKLSGVDVVGTAGASNTIQLLDVDDFTVELSNITNNNVGRSCILIGLAPARALRPVIRRNFIYNCGNPANGNQDHAIYDDSSSNATITENVIFGQQAYGIQFYPDSQNTSFTHNVVSGTGSVTSDTIFGGDTTATSNGNIAEFNVVANSPRYNVESTWTGTVGSGNIFRNNCTFNGSLGSVSTTNGGFTATANTNTSPLFVNTAGNDYRLGSGSGCLTVVGYDTAALLGTPPSPPPVAGTAFVASGGLDSNACTSLAPCLTFSRACQAVGNGGGTVQIAAGFYPGQSVRRVDCNPSADTVFKPAPGATVTVNGRVIFGQDGTSTAPDHMFLDGTGATFIVKGVEVQYGGSGAGAAFDTVKGMHITDMGTSGGGPALLWPRDTQNFSALNNEIGPGCCASDAIQLSIRSNGNPGLTNTVIDSNYIHNMYDSCTKVPSGLPTCTGNGFGDACGSCTHVDGIHGFSSNGLTISNNRIYMIDPNDSISGQSAQGIFLQVENGGTFSNVDIFNNMITCGCAFNIASLSGPGTGVVSGFVKIRYNTIVGRSFSSGGFIIYDSSGSQMMVPTTQVIYSSNITNGYIHANPSAVSPCTYVSSTGGTITPTWTKNLFADNSGNCGSNIAGTANFVSTNQLGPDLHLNGSNPLAQNNGDPTYCPATDIDGQARNCSAPDIGADEVP